ncbi:MAG: hypothetical protein HQL25_03685 [Candidatus Omnitrophica bacterium]|nr:hypothetical protein [Candidatus Omnitrophota bacterium]
MNIKVLKILIILFFIAAAFFLKSFIWWGNVLQIQNLNTIQTISLQANNASGSVNYLKLLITGNIDGSVKIQRADSEKLYEEPIILKGQVNLKLRGDWYDKKCLIFYTPTNVKSGKLQIRYKFSS